MNRRTLVRPLLACFSLAVAASCGPTEQAQTVAFVLSLTSERVSNIRFTVGYDTGKFSETDGACTVSSAAGPRAASVAESTLLEKDAVYGMTRKERRLRAENVAVSATPGSTSTTNPAGLDGGEICGDGIREGDEECDDGNEASGDGCDGNCEAEFEFSAVDDDEGELTIEITNGLGIPPGAALAFCKFQGDLELADLSVTTRACSLPNGTACADPEIDAPVAVSTTTTTTTTTTSTVSTTSTTNGDGTSTTSSTQPEE